MKLLARYGRHAVAGLVALGLLSVISAFALFSQPITAEVWAAGEEVPEIIRVEDPIAANWLMRAGIPLFPGDAIQYAGVEILHSMPLPLEARQKILYKPAYPILAVVDGEALQFFSAANTLGEALWEQGYPISAGDWVSLPLGTPLNQALTVEIKKARPLVIEINGEEIAVQSAGDTVAEVLAEAGVALQELDYSQPDESLPVPADRHVRVVRVREETVLEESTIAFSEERIADPEISIGDEKVLQSGQNGTRTSKVRIRYEDGEEISRRVESEWVSKQPVSQKVAYGTNITVQSYASADGTVDYWLEKEVYITSYRDTGNPTASGVWPYYGTIAVSPEWYSILKGSSIYVPGYGVGTVLDICPGCSGKNWIDVFIPTADYVSWNVNETVYFLPPVPAGFSGYLP